ncbi:MAG TPA: hypothetical protein VF699_05195 [Caulobacteraceae bacterium]
MTNTVTLDYSVGGVPQTAVQASATFVVDTKIDLTVTKNADAASIAPGSANRVLAFTLANTGNSTQGYMLTAVQGAATMTMTNVRIFRDVNANGAYDSGTDTLYTPGTNVGDLAADATQRLLIVADTPAGATDGQSAVWFLVAQALNAGTTTVSTQTAGADNKDTIQVVFADGDGDAGTNDSARDGKHTSFGTFTVAAASLAVTKTSTVVSDPLNGSTDPKRIPGARIRYSITATNSGSAAATSVVMTDPIPANTAYVPGSITLNLGGGATPKTDVGGDDEVDYNATVAGAVRAAAGTIAASGGSVTLVFDVTVN